MRKRPALAAALIYAVLSLVMVAPGLVPGRTLSNSDLHWFKPPWAGVRPAELKLPSNSELGDAPGQLQPFLRYAKERLPDMPLWNPYIVGGRPFLANAQAAIFSPYSLPAYALPYWTALGWIAFMKFWVAAFGMFLLGRALGMRFGGALVAGIAWAFSLWMVTWVSYPHMSVWTYLPWMLLLTERVVRKPGLLSGAGLAAVVALQFVAGHPESSAHCLLTMLAFYVFRLVQVTRAARPEERRVGRTSLAFVGACAGGAGLAAVALFPFLELLLDSADFYDRQGSAIDVEPIVRTYALSMFLPSYWGLPTATPIRPFLLDRAFYVGALPLMLAGAALVIRPTALRIAAAVWGALWFAVLLSVPPFLQIVTRLPVFSSGHNSRLAVLVVFPLALLAGFGMDDLLRGGLSERSRKLLLTLAAGLLVLPLLYMLQADGVALGHLKEAIKVAWGFVDPPGVSLADNGGRQCVPCDSAGDVIRLSALVIWLTLAGAALLLLWLRLRGRIGTTPFLVLAALLVCVDLFRAGVGYNPSIDRDIAEQPVTPAIRVLERDRSHRFVSIEEVPQNAIPMDFKLYEARGYDLPIMRRFDRFWRREVSPESSSVSKGLLNIPLTFRNVTPRALRALRLLGVTEVLQPPTLPPLTEPGLRLIYEGPDARVYRLSDALPRTFVVSAQQVVDDDQKAFDTVTQPGFDGRRVAVTEKAVAGLPQGAAGGGTAAGSAAITRYEPERVVIRARSAGQGMLVLGDNYFPGWKAEVDGRSADIERVDYLFRGVRIGPGTHTIEFRYQPLSFRLGWIVSLLSLLGLVAVVAVGLRRRSRPAAPAPPRDA
jgi:Bacterial membrane protein YfhO